jgi:hypothetical protein
VTAPSPYLAWNNALAGRFFRPEAAGQPVYLFVTQDVIEEVGVSLGGGVTDFIAAVQAGPPGTTRLGLCQRALQVADRWHSRDSTYPPYLAYLGLFVLAGGHDGDFDPRSYYPRLWELLGEPDMGTPPSFERMLELWDDLEHWSVRDRRGELGIFEAKTIGGKVHIGLPLAQTVLTEADRRALPRVFANAGFDPDSPPSDRELQRALTIDGRQSLRPRTIKALEGGASSFIAALLDVVSNEFLEWDGNVPPPAAEPETRPQIVAALRLCLSLDRVAGTARVAFRCRSRKPLPDDGLVFLAPGTHWRLSCTESIPGWSSPLAREDTAEEYIPPGGVWNSGLVLATEGGGWTLRARAGRLRVFLDGAAEALPGLIEVPQLPHGRPFYLAYPESAWPRLLGWVESDCRGFKPIPLTSGLPPGWALASIQEATTDAGARAVDPQICFPDRRSLRLIGGIRAAPGNTFFAFAPPHLMLDGAEPGDTVLCNGQQLREMPSSPGIYEIPHGGVIDSRLGLEVRNRDDVVRRLSLYLVSGAAWRLDTPLASFDRTGCQTKGGSGISGASVPDLTAGALSQDVFRTPGLNPRAQRIYFIGRGPGQIAAWPAESLPEWEPVWAVPFARRGQAVYCGGSLAASGPLGGDRAERRRIELWKRILWRWRAHVTPPREKPLKALWRRYREAARDT